MYILEIILKVINKLATVLHLPKDKLRRSMCAVLSKRVEVSVCPFCLNDKTDIDLGPLLTATPPPKKKALWEMRM
jgi:hypothetical protein